jgi:hypothetical protein
MQTPRTTNYEYEANKLSKMQLPLYGKVPIFGNQNHQIKKLRSNEISIFTIIILLK